MRASTIVMFIFVIGAFGLAYMHEQAHVQIYRSYGVDSHVEYLSHFPDLVTIGDEPCPVESCNLAHNINEVVGYPLFVFYFVFGFMGLFVVVLLEGRSLKNSSI